MAGDRTSNIYNPGFGGLWRVIRRARPRVTSWRKESRLWISLSRPSSQRDDYNLLLRISNLIHSENTKKLDKGSPIYTWYGRWERATESFSTGEGHGISGEQEIRRKNKWCSEGPEEAGVTRRCEVWNKVAAGKQGGRDGEKRLSGRENGRSDDR